MLPFLCLLILCGLLTQNAQGNGHPFAIANLSPELLQQVLSQRMNSQALKDRLLNLPLEDMVKNGIKQGSGGGGLLSGLPLVGGLLNNVVGGVLGLKIKKVSLLDLDIALDPHEARLIVTIPADIEVELKCPLNLLSRLLHLKLYLDVQVGVRIVKHPVTGHIRLTIENCQNNPGHLRITLLDNISPLLQLVNRVVRLVTDVLEKTLPHLLQKELCPLVNGIVQNVLDLLQGSFNSQMHGEVFHLSPEDIRLHDGSLTLAYDGNLQMPGGHSVMIPAPLPFIPLEGSSMNMVVSLKYLASALQALLPPQVINIGGQSEISNIQALQMASGAPSLSLVDGEIQVWQPVELRGYRERSAGAYGPLFTSHADLVFNADVSVANGKLIFVLVKLRIANLRLLSSSIGNIPVQHLTNAITWATSRYLLPHENKLLADGVPVPLLNDLGVRSVHISVHKDTLLLSVTTGMAPESA